MKRTWVMMMVFLMVALVETTLGISMVALTQRGTGQKETAGEKTGENPLLILSIEPKSPAQLKGGEQVQLKIQYQSPSKRPVFIWAQADTRNTFYAPSQELKDRTGEVSRFVGSNEPNQVKAIKVVMVDSKTRETVAEIRQEVDYSWEGWAEGTQPLVYLNEAFPELRFTAVDGTEVDIAKLKGKVVLIDFWATWCGPCVGEVPHLLNAYKQHHDQGFEIVGISLDKDKETLLGFIKKKGMAWPQLLDEDKTVATRFAVRVIPTMFLLDRQGVVRYIDPRGNDLEKAVALLCSQP